MYRALLVDDDPAQRLLTRRVLDRSGFFDVIGEADDGDVAIERSGELRPDVVVLDLSMPRVSGLDALPEIRRRAPEAQVVVLSMLPRARFEQKVLDRGAVAFLDKGTPLRQLVPRLLAVLRNDAGAAGMDAPAAQPG